MKLKKNKNRKGDYSVVKNKLEIIKSTPYLFTCDVTQSDFNYLLNKIDKIHKDLLQMKKFGNCKYVDIDYMLNAIENDKY